MVYKGKNVFYHTKNCKYLSGDIKEYASPEEAEKDKLVACTFCKPKVGFETQMNPPEFETVDTSDLPFPTETDETEILFKNSPVIGNNTNNSYHLPTCKFAPKNTTKRIEFTNAKEALANGYKPCTTCNPYKE